MRQVHTFLPVWDADARILLLGTFPSIQSRENGFYYGHPQNRFWRVLADVLQTPLPKTVSEKKEMLLSHHIALWDVCASCEIQNSSDASIQDIVPNDILPILQNAPIKAIFVNGKTAQRLYDKYLLSQTKRECIPLPSTSPANCRVHYDALLAAWRQLSEFIHT